MKGLHEEIQRTKVQIANLEAWVSRMQYELESLAWEANKLHKDQQISLQLAVEIVESRYELDKRRETYGEPESEFVTRVLIRARDFWLDNQEVDLFRLVSPEFRLPETWEEAVRAAFRLESK